MRIDSVTADELDAISRNSQYDERTWQFTSCNRMRLTSTRLKPTSVPITAMILGFPAKYMVIIDFDTVREDSRR